MASFLLIFVFIVRDCSAQWQYNDTNNSVNDWAQQFPFQCSGISQSPIDVIINSETSNCEKPLLLEWQSPEQIQYVIKHNGHSLQGIPFTIQHNGGTDLSGLEVLHFANDTSIRLRNLFYYTYRTHLHREYCLDSFHFHWGTTDFGGSEHLINGEQYPLELHLVHYACDYYLAGDAVAAFLTPGETEDDPNVLAVIGVLFEIGPPNPLIDIILNKEIIDNIFEYIPENNGENEIDIWYTEPFNVAGLLPSNREIVAYLGSLTTPPCYETVRWHVMKNTMTVSTEQLDELRRLLLGTEAENDQVAPNFRPVQDIANRTIYQCQEQVDADNIYLGYY